MKRDMDLIRELLIQIESKNIKSSGYFNIPKYDIQTIKYHLMLLKEASLIEAYYITTDQGGMEDIIIDYITWNGHEFLDAVRNDSIWKDVKKLISNKVTSVPFDILMLLLSNIIKQHLNV